MFTNDQKQSITDVFEDVKIEDSKAHIHVDTLDHNDIVGMATLHVEHGISINVKRSGTGMTVEMQN